jgi:hypothetical protein
MPGYVERVSLVRWQADVREDEEHGAGVRSTDVLTEAT